MEPLAHLLEARHGIICATSSATSMSAMFPSAAGSSMLSSSELKMERESHSTIHSSSAAVPSWKRPKRASAAILWLPVVVVGSKTQQSIRFDKEKQLKEKKRAGVPWSFVTMAAAMASTSRWLPAINARHGSRIEISWLLAAAILSFLTCGSL
jgi:hypothetical protein